MRRTSCIVLKRESQLEHNPKASAHERISVPVENLSQNVTLISGENLERLVHRI